MIADDAEVVAEAAGETAVGYSREVYLDCPPGDQSDWITELQFVLE